MSPEAAVDPVPPEVTSLSAREAAFKLARAGGILRARHLRALVGLSKSGFVYHQRAGHYDAMLMKGRPAGTRCLYSGALVIKFMEGDALLATPRVFGRRTFK
jgi:hypothetical protein